MRVLGRLFPALIAIAAILVFAACSSSSSDDDDVPQDQGDPAWNAVPITGYPYPVQMFDNQVPGGIGRHFAQGEFPGFGKVQYNTDPPTSGPHVGNFVANGIHEEGVPDEVLVHMMEHGYVVAWYNCGASVPPAAALTEEECATLRSNLSSVVQSAVSGGKHVLMVPDDSMSNQIAITSWQFADKFDVFDAARVQTFIDTFNCRFDPEGGCAG